MSMTKRGLEEAKVAVMLSSMISSPLLTNCWKKTKISIALSPETNVESCLMTVDPPCPTYQTARDHSPGSDAIDLIAAQL
jgi:hypothetical protein